MIVSVDTPSDSDYLALTDEALLGQCDVHVYKSSGPGGQHRNKVSSAVRLRHRPSGISAHGDETRSQHQNRRAAIRRLRMNIACGLRRPVRISPDKPAIPEVVATCLIRARRAAPGTKPKLKVARRDRRFWPVAGFLLDLLDAFEGGLADAADCLGISTANLTTFLKSDRHLLAAAQQIRKSHGRQPMN